MKSYIHRLAEPLFSQTAEIMRIVLVSGPRQCGKTTLLKAMLTKDDLFLTFDDDETLRSAIADPNAFLRFYSQKYKRIALDEIQKAPVLLGALKKTADEDPRPGRFLISGSSNYQALPGAVESLAGRLGEVRLRTMSAREMAGNCSVDLIDRLCQKDFGPLFYSPQDCSKSIVLAKALEGGYPGIIGKQPQSRSIWFRNYISRLIEKDLKDLGSFEKNGIMQHILDYLCLNSSRTLNVATLAQALGTTGVTLRRYLSALQTMYLVNEVPAWSKIPISRITKAPKWFISDSGLMGACTRQTNIDSFMLWVAKNGKAGSDFIGNLIETWVYNQLAPAIEATQEWSLYHLRVSERQEIDFVLENSLGELLLIEVKASESIATEDFNHIRWFSECNQGNVLGGIVLYCGQTVRTFGENLTAVPMAALWNS